MLSAWLHHYMKWQVQTSVAFLLVLLSSTSSPTKNTIQIQCLGNNFYSRFNMV